MSGNGPVWPGQDGQQEQTGGTPPQPGYTPAPLPWEQQTQPEQPYGAPDQHASQPASPTPYGQQPSGEPVPPYGQPSAPEQIPAPASAAPQQPAPYGSPGQPAPYGGPGQPAPYGGAPQPGPAQQPYGGHAYGDQQPYGGQPAAPSQSGSGGQSPYGSPAPQPKRKGLPAWGWWALGVGAAVVIGAIVVVTMVIVNVLPFTADGPDDDGGTGGGGTGGDTASADYPLTMPMDGELAVVWATPELGSEWTVEDQDSDYFFASHEGGCTFEAQTMGLVEADAAAADDGEASEADFPAFLDEIAAGTEIAEQEYAAVDSVAIQSDAGTIEYAAFDVTLTWNDGSESLERWYWRSYVDLGVSMYTYLSCGSGNFSESLMDDTIGSLVVE